MIYPKIRSFVRRGGRITPSQKKAFDDLWSKYGVNLSEPLLDYSPQIVEIGFGMGHSLVAMAEQFPEYNFLGIEVYQPGVGTILNAIQKKNLNNIRVASEDATDVFCHFLSHSLDAVLIFFPDPWPKKRHYKRRLIQPDFMELVIQKIKPGGYIHIATDWQSYAEHIDSVLAIFPSLQRVENPSQKILPRILTKFEQRGERLGHKIHEFIFKVSKEP